MKNAIAPTIGFFSAISVKAASVAQTVTVSGPELTVDVVIYYLAIGFIGALGGWFCKQFMKRFEKTK